MKVTIVNDVKKQLRSGMNVQADFQVGRLENAMVVPTAAVVRQDNLTGVFVMSANQKPPSFIPIQTGVTDTI